MIKGTTESGYQFEVNPDIIKDFTFLRAYRNANSKDVYKQIDGFTDMVELLLGDKVEEYYAFLRDHFKGIVPTDVLGRDIGSIIRTIENESESAKK